MTKRVSKPTGNPKGRPKKAEKRSVGRPKGEASIIAEYRTRMLNSPRSAKVLDSIYDAALNDDHKHQAAAWKLVMDRIAPVSSFEKEAGSQVRQSMQIVVKDVGQVIVNEEPPEAPIEAIETEYTVKDIGDE